MPLVLFPDVEAWLVGYLTAQLAARAEPYASDVHVDITVPNPRPDRMVIIRRDGGPRVDPVRELALVSFRVWGETDDVATDLANLVRALVTACPDGKPVCKAREQSGPVPVPDESGQPLRYFVAELTVRGSAA